MSTGPGGIFGKGIVENAALAALKKGGEKCETGKPVGFCPTTSGQAKWWDVQITPMLDTRALSDAS